MSLFGFSNNKKNYEEESTIESYLKKGAIVLDVRTEEEYEMDHVANSTHIQLDYIADRLDEIKAFDKPIIAVCRSGNRSGQATAILKEVGLDAINGGPWDYVNGVVEDL